MCGVCGMRSGVVWCRVGGVYVVCVGCGVVWCGAECVVCVWDVWDVWDVEWCCVVWCRVRGVCVVCGLVLGGMV